LVGSCRTVQKEMVSSSFFVGAGDETDGSLKRRRLPSSLLAGLKFSRATALSRAASTLRSMPV